jgi:hypothetical protein
MVGGNKDENGLYLGKFETREESLEYIKKLANRYRYAPNQKRISIRKLVAEAREQGIRLNRTSLGRWFRQLGVEIRNVRVERESTKTNQTYSVSNEIIEEIDEYPNKSYLVELGLRLVTRMPIEDVILFFPKEKDGSAVNAIFKKETNGKVSIQATGKLTNRDRQQLRVLMELANEQGLGVVVDFAERYNYKWYGAE